MNESHLSLVVTHWVTSELGLALNCELSYDAGDPLAVCLVFTGQGPRSVRWVFSRELLAEGLNARTGEGDVALWPVLDEDGETDCLRIRLGGDRTALIELDAAPVAEWLAETYGLVPPGTELDGVDWDELAAQLAE
ncbi:SsgA family sporulation/cell division regulator [Streptomyces sp. NPDC052225]|uniref:SsgA family sporulation/cell division regulator n=1 Tax=Streptomyces sp. NPDC052225 TaxID=3154949 RepID=UPI003427349F